jgi:hypothetical protein
MAMMLKPSVCRIDQKTTGSIDEDKEVRLSGSLRMKLGEQEYLSV